MLLLPSDHPFSCHSDSCLKDGAFIHFQAEPKIWIQNISRVHSTRRVLPPNSNNVIFCLLLHTNNNTNIRKKSWSAPCHDTAAVIVLRCTKGEQRSCTFYTAEPVWSSLQRRRAGTRVFMNKGKGDIFSSMATCWDFKAAGRSPNKNQYGRQLFSHLS